MSKTDKTDPFWVKSMRGDLASEEVHDHRDGVCDMPSDADAYHSGGVAAAALLPQLRLHRRPRLLLRHVPRQWRLGCAAR